MSIIEQYNIQFKNVKSDGWREKIAVSDPVTDGIHDFVLSHITTFKNPETIQEFIDNVDKALVGNFNLIDDPDVSNNFNVAFITADGVEFWDEEYQNIIPPLYSLEHFKEILIAWKLFLETPPYDDQTAN